MIRKCANRLDPGLGFLMRYPVSLFQRHLFKRMFGYVPWESTTYIMHVLLPKDHLASDHTPSMMI